MQTDPIPTPEPRKRRFILPLALAVLLAGGYVFSRHARAPDSAAPPPSARHCDLNRQTCVHPLPDGGEIAIDVSPRPIPLVKPFFVRVVLKNKNADRVQLRFSGVDMNMGFNQARLEKGARGEFTGRAMLPVCTTGRMRWQADFVVESGATTHLVPLQFETGAQESGIDSERDSNAP
ncbi:MAG: hypothetical protein LBO79_01965 [Zoogloeaceae bacterium]|jgi:hypothetical protein|nr:hypothetical protein [Zoogloeaceae bacterium]